MHYYPGISAHAAAFSTKNIEGIISSRVPIYYTWRVSLERDNCWQNALSEGIRTKRDLNPSTFWLRVESTNRYTTVLPWYGTDLGWQVPGAGRGLFTWCYVGLVHDGTEWSTFGCQHLKQRVWSLQLGEACPADPHGAVDSQTRNVGLVTATPVGEQ